MRKKVLILTISFLILGATFLFRIGSSQDDAISVKVITAKKKDVYNSVVTSGTVSDNGIYNVVFSEDSTIEEVYVALGKRVKEGELLLTRQITSEYPAFFAKEFSGFAEQVVSAISQVGIQLETEFFVPTISYQQTTIKSPINGVITELNVQPKQPVNGFTVVAQISDYSAREVVVELPELYLSSVALGQDVTITGDAFPEKKYNGKVIYIANEAKEKNHLMGSSEVYVPVRISITDADVQLKPGYRVSARICTEKRKNAIVIPYQCIFQDQAGKEIVYVIKDDTIYRKRIITGLELPKETEVLYGLNEGDIVVESPEETWKNGQKVVAQK